MLTSQPRAIAIRLGREKADEIFDIIEEASASGNVKPAAFEFSRSDALGLFDRDESEPLLSVCGVYGAVDDDAAVKGFIALQPLDLDGGRLLEFMIFFRRSRGAHDPVMLASEVIRDVRRRAGAPIVTLVFGENTRGKRFYERAGFAFDRVVTCEGFPMELWRFNGGAD